MHTGSLHAKVKGLILLMCLPDGSKQRKKRIIQQISLSLSLWVQVSEQCARPVREPSLVSLGE